MIFLTSDGLSSKKLQSKAALYTQAFKKALVISISSKEKNLGARDSEEQLRSLGLTVDFLNLAQDKVDLVSDYSVVLLSGGNPFQFLQLAREKKLKPYLEKIARSGVLIGISGGALILQPSIELVLRYLPHLNRKVGLTDFTGLELVEIEIIPHFSRQLEQNKSLLPFLENRTLTSNSLYPLEDGEGVWVSAKDNPAGKVIFLS